MFLEEMFGNIYGYIWLLIFLVAVVALALWIILKKEKETNDVIEDDNVSSEEVEVKEEIKTIWPTQVIKPKASEKTKEEIDTNNLYEIIESEDGFFRVKKKGNDRTLRKFSARIEAENFIDKKEIK